MKNKQAFTLIELLVVVLIIGILAAVAVPQYQKAVNKTRFANLRTVAKVYYKAAQAYQLANGEWPADFDVLAVELPAGQTISATNVRQCGVGSEMWCCIFPASSGLQNEGITCGRKDYSFGYEFYYNREHCVAKLADSQATALCKSIGGNPHSINFITPEGHREGYAYYPLK